MFIEKLFNDPKTYFFWVFAVLYSVILHELAHGWAAIWQGDRTPIERGHMTLDPTKHMPPMSLFFLAFVGLCWGMMPVNPYRFRSKYGDAYVSAAGPAMNLALAIVSLILIVIVTKVTGTPTDFTANLLSFLFLSAQLNIVLMLFNLFPAPPLDGSRILAGVNTDFRNWLTQNEQMHMPLFIGAIILLNVLDLFGFAARLCLQILSVLV